MGKKLGGLLIDTVDIAVADRDADERRQDALRRGVYVVGVIGGTAVNVALGDEFAVAQHKQR